jgi:hypothetical protein
MGRTAIEEHTSDMCKVGPALRLNVAPSLAQCWGSVPRTVGAAPGSVGHQTLHSARARYYPPPHLTLPPSKIRRTYTVGILQGGLYVWAQLTRPWLGGRTDILQDHKFKTGPRYSIS